ncbi:MAG: hypothetical protein V3R52_05175, partial [Candidatus Neomarinimicrobiota bacterium]
MKKRPLIIGIDGGASKVSAFVVEAADGGNSFKLGVHNSTREYHDFQSDFTPVDLPTQLEQIYHNNIMLTPAEEDQAKVFSEAIFEVISDIVQVTKPENILIGIGMPGIKTADKRGIAAMANGPRMPNFVREIEQKLSAAGIALATPVGKLGSDADYCGIGEEYAENGGFRTTENAYYLGGG